MPAKADAQPTYPVDVIAKLLLLSPRRVQQLSKEGIIPKAGRGRYALAPAVQGYIRFLTERIDPTGKNDGVDLGSEKALLTRAKREREELRLAVERGQSVLIADVASIYGEDLATLRARILAIPPRVSLRLVGEQDAGVIEARLLDEIAAALKAVTEAPAVVAKAVARSKAAVSEDDAGDADDDPDTD